jgi:hypothetical protein
MTTPEALAEAAMVASDNAQVARLRLEARAVRLLDDGERLAEALAIIEDAVPAIYLKSLAPLAERLGRAYSRTLARMRRSERKAVKAILRRTE